MDKKYFPIKTDTACQLKWAWSTIYLNSGVTRSCHRTGESMLNEENFFNFHNTDRKISDRKKMLQGQWPESSCKYCKSIEDRGGVSDRIRMLSIPNLTPEELFEDKSAVKIFPTLVEVYFNNTCNLGCVYCSPYLSSKIEFENKKFGDFEKHGVKIFNNKDKYFKNLVPLFWEWFDQGFKKIKRLHVLGGEPFYQKEFDFLLEKIEQNPNANCELNIVTNLAIDQNRLEDYIKKFKHLLLRRTIKRIEITCSIDCWGVEQEYVRYGLDLIRWERNFETLLSQKWLTLNINQTITPLTIKTMPHLINRLKKWRQSRPVGHYFSGAFPIPDYLRLDVLGSEIFADDIKVIMESMPTENKEDLLAKEYMQGILNEILESSPDFNRIRDLIIFLDEKDRRRNLSWRQTFPWLAEIEKNVV